MSDPTGADAHHNTRVLPAQPSLRHLKVEAKRRLADGQFTTLHEAQLAIAREHGMSSWAVLKRQVVAAEAEHTPAMAHVRWLLGRYAHAGDQGWVAPSRDELNEHFTDNYLSLIPPESVARALGSVAARLAEDLIVLDVSPRHVRGRIAGLRVEAATEEDAPYRLAVLRVDPTGTAVTDARVAQPPAAGFGPVPSDVPDILRDAFADLGLVALAAAGDGEGGPAAGWEHYVGWADLDRDVPLRPGHRFPARAITKLITSTAVLRLVAAGEVALDEPVNGRLTALRLADDAITVRELLAHTGGVDSPPSMWADSAAEVADVLGPVVACSGRRGRFAYGNGGYAVLGELVAGLTGVPFPQAATRLVLEPLGMADSWFPAEVPPDAPRGYRLTDEGTFEPEALRPVLFPSAGGLWSSGRDLVRFGSGWRTLLPARLAEEALRPQAPQGDGIGQVGLGWLVQPGLGGLAGHHGYGPGWSTSLIVRLDTGRTSVAFTNRLLSLEPVNARLTPAAR